MTTTRLASAGLLALALMLAPASAFATPSGLGYIKPDSALLPTPGTHRMADGRTLAVGTLHYQDKDGGYWGIFSDPGHLGHAPVALATFTDTSSVDANLWRQDGQYAFVEGTPSSGGLPTMTVDAFRLVVDVVDPYPGTRIDSPGLYNQRNGSVLAFGWLQFRGSKAHPLKGWVVATKKPVRLANRGGVIVELVHVSLADRRAFRPGSSVGMYGSLVGTAPRGPAFYRFGGWSFSPPGQGLGALVPGDWYSWRHIERPGLKDLPLGRKRLVGVFATDWFGGDLKSVPVTPDLPMPFPYGSSSMTAACADIAAFSASVPRPLDQRPYAAAEGRITSTTPDPFSSWRGQIPLLSADSFEVITTP